MDQAAHGLKITLKITKMLAAKRGMDRNMAYAKVIHFIVEQYKLGQKSLQSTILPWYIRKFKEIRGPVGLGQWTGPIVSSLPQFLEKLRIF